MSYHSSPQKQSLVLGPESPPSLSHDHETANSASGHRIRPGGTWTGRQTASRRFRIAEMLPRRVINANLREGTFGVERRDHATIACEQAVGGRRRDGRGGNCFLKTSEVNHLVLGLGGDFKMRIETMNCLKSLLPLTELGCCCTSRILLQKSDAAVVGVFGANWTDPLARD